METSVQQFKVGDRVKVIKDESGREEGEEGTITSATLSTNDFSGGGYADVQFADGNSEMRFNEIELIACGSPAPSEITIGGVRYTLTPVQEAEAAPEPKREPKQGEVWTYESSQGTNYWLITDETAVCVKGGAQKVGFVHVGKNFSNYAYAYPDLRAAIAAGVLS